MFCFLQAFKVDARTKMNTKTVLSKTSFVYILEVFPMCKHMAANGGSITGFVPAGDFSSPAVCTLLKLKNLQKYVAIEINISHFLLPQGCRCNADNAYFCHYISLIISGTTRRFCSATAQPICISKGNVDELTFIFTKNDFNREADFTLTYKCKSNWFLL